MNEIIKDVLTRLKGVEYVHIVSNNTLCFDHVTQLPAASVRIIVKGGKKRKIAETIYLYKSLGILLEGNTKVKVKDSMDIKHSIKFEVVK